MAHRSELKARARVGAAVEATAPPPPPTSAAAAHMRSAFDASPRTASGLVSPKTCAHGFAAPATLMWFGAQGNVCPRSRESSMQRKSGEKCARTPPARRDRAFNFFLQNFLIGLPPPFSNLHKFII